MQGNQEREDEQAEEGDGQQPDGAQQHCGIVPYPLPVADPVRADVQRRHAAGQPDAVAPQESHQRGGQRIEDHQAHEEHLQGKRKRRICVRPATGQVEEVSAGALKEASDVRRENPSRPDRLSAPSFPQPKPHRVTLDGAPNLDGGDRAHRDLGAAANRAG